MPACERCEPLLLPYLYDVLDADERGEVEGHLYATEEQTVTLRDLGLELDLQRGTSINVGFSAKFDRPAFVTAVSALGFKLACEWIDTQWQYGIFLFSRL